MLVDASRAPENIVSQEAANQPTSFDNNRKSGIMPRRSKPCSLRARGTQNVLVQ
jgi:hypothetical protein